jgi:two-component system, NarL family, response regulator LiaR
MRATRPESDRPAAVVSEETVKSHVSAILAKLGLSDRTQAAIFGLQHHLVPLDQALEDKPAGLR